MAYNLGIGEGKTTGQKKKHHRNQIYRNRIQTIIQQSDQVLLKGKQFLTGSTSCNCHITHFKQIVGYKFNLMISLKDRLHCGYDTLKILVVIYLPSTVWWTFAIANQSHFGIFQIYSKVDKWTSLFVHGISLLSVCVMSFMIQKLKLFLK